MCVRGEELLVGTKLGFTKWGLTKVKLISFNILICQGVTSSSNQHLLADHCLCDGSEWNDAQR